MQHSEEDIYHRIALNFASGIGHKYAAALIEGFGSAKDVLSAPLKQLLKIEGMGEIRAKAIKDLSVFELAEKEMAFITAKNIQVLTQENPDYPQRFLECTDAPQLLFYKGIAKLNKSKNIAVIGTRKNTEYGQRLTNDLIDGLSKIPDVNIISGLAHGIDTIAHKAALKNNFETIGVLGHGLNTIYPAANSNLAKEMLEQGGLLTEFPAESKVEKGNFPARNRIVAGISDVTIIVESDIKGGALITGYIANSYNREVAAFPGRAYDSKSSGTNMMIRKNLASLITSADDLLDLMGWQKQKKQATVQTQLMLHLSEEEKSIIEILQEKDTTHADELQKRTNMGSSQLASCLLMLEMQGLIKTLPGKHYRMN
ncbi:MAG: DNA-processing protein DprA [Chitinophagaceae bacterium]|jgi:DNA processing protein